MVEQDMPKWQSRAHFFGIAARLMRQILVDYARQRKATKRGAEQIRVPLDSAAHSTLYSDGERVLTLDAALTKLAALDQRKSQVLEMRVFGGMKLADIATALEVSEPTIKRDMRMAKAWLRVEIGH
jgi:RNA polymerase sigma factor (TIGR02999 family)